MYLGFILCLCSVWAEGRCPSGWVRLCSPPALVFGQRCSPKGTISRRRRESRGGAQVWRPRFHSVCDCVQLFKLQSRYKCQFLNQGRFFISNCFWAATPFRQKVNRELGWCKRNALCIRNLKVTRVDCSHFSSGANFSYDLCVSPPLHLKMWFCICRWRRNRKEQKE